MMLKPFTVKSDDGKTFYKDDGAPAAKPIDMLLFCPKCGEQHVDAPEDHEVDKGSHTDVVLDWTNPPHKSHLCHACKTVWRPADVETNGVKAIATRGKADTWDSTARTCAAEISRLEFLLEDSKQHIDHLLSAARKESTPATSAQDSVDAQRYRKLRRWMSSNVKEGWREVENLAAVACYVDWNEFNLYLDSLPECNVGLCESPTNAQAALVKATS